MWASCTQRGDDGGESAKGSLLMGTAHRVLVRRGMAVGSNLVQLDLFFKLEDVVKKS